MTDRVVLFIDYQNVYRRARDRYHRPSSAARHGQVDPLRLAELLVARGRVGAERVLGEVRVYGGQPDATKDPRSNAAHQAQCDAWRAHPRTTVVTRPLSYPQGWPAERAQEKGIDVALAIDFVAMAVRGEYDVGILVSTDTDLKPALEAVVELSRKSNVRCEVAAWSSPDQAPRRLSIPGVRIWCHWLGRSDYDAVEDPTDYTR